MYITHAKDAMFIHSVVANVLGDDICDVFIDAFACVGGDTLAAINQFGTSKIYSVQPAFYGKNERFESLNANIINFKTLTGKGAETKPKNMDIKSFIESEELPQNISVLYLDPPWSLQPCQPPSVDLCPEKHDQFKGYSSPLSIGWFIFVNVFDPLKKKGILPKIIALKLPGIPTYPSINGIISRMGENYRQYAFLTPRKKYAVFIFKLEFPV